MAAGERVICSADALVDGGDGVRFEADVRGTRLAAFAIRFEGRVHAYLNQCAHIAMELDWNEGKFFDADGIVLVCSTHGAIYDPASGQCVGGPCRGACLERVAIEETAGVVRLKVE